MSVNFKKSCCLRAGQRFKLEKRTKKFIHDYDKFAAPYSDAHCG